jgi:hypothetical protein
VTLLAIFGTAAAIYVFSLVVGLSIDRWGQSVGIEQKERKSGGRLALGMACVIFAPALGAYVATFHLVLLALTIPIAIAGLVAGILILKGGENVPPQREVSEGPPHAGFAYLWHCWLPLRLHDYTRPMLTALTLPPLTVLMLVIGRWWIAAALGAISVFGWILMLRAKPRSTPRGRCLRATAE